MGTDRFDRLTRACSTVLSRRGLASVLGLVASTNPGLVAAKKQRRKKLKKNEYGCVKVGGRCRGKDANCCSGRCQGKKPKKGGKDKSTCVTHNVGNCPAGADYCLGDGTSCTNGLCWQTTGQASFCAAGGTCVPCTKDADCEASEGPGAACVVCSALCMDLNTVCLSAANP